MAVGDAVITGTLSAFALPALRPRIAGLTTVECPAYYLRQVRSDFSATNSLIDRIVRGIVANNLLVCLSPTFLTPQH